MSIFRTGYIVAVLLAVFTVVEYVFALNSLGVSDEVRIVGLSASAIVKAALILWFFMHFYRLWRGEEAH